MLWLRALWRPPAQQFDGDESLPFWGKIVLIAYLVAWLSLGVALYAFWWEWSAPIKYSLAFVEALLAPDLASIKSAFGKSRA